MNLSCPAIVSDRVGCAYDLVVPGQTGWVFPTGNLEALTQCLADAIMDPKHLRHIGETARNHVSHFSYDGITANLQPALDHVCGRDFRLNNVSFNITTPAAVEPFPPTSTRSAPDHQRR